MSDTLGTYTFVPWVRRGIANEISGVSTSGRATFDIRVDLSGDRVDGGTESRQVDKAVQLYGPGDIIGIDGDEISRVEPENWVTNFEPNYLAGIEFYSEDFPWRYSPVAAAGRRLLPWLALMVLEEGESGEFTEGAGIGNRPLPFIDVTANFADVFPQAVDAWAWAHAHFNSAFSSNVMETDSALASRKADEVIQTAPDTACSRLLCPRKLKPNTSYHAFLFPAFESGRLAGLGRGNEIAALFGNATNALTPTSSSWGAYADRPDNSQFPFYHRWAFRTAERGDFESLVRLLKPQPVDPEVGHRDMDVTDPAPNIVGITKPELAGILRLGGALKAPLGAADQAEFDVFDQWGIPYPAEFQRQLAAFVNLADSYQKDGAGANNDGELSSDVQNDPLPLVTPPIYGRWHALSERLLTDRDTNPLPTRENWLHDLNLDPRWRVAAGFGTKVVQNTQETYMEAAWDQIGDVIEANRRIRAAQLAIAAGTKFHSVLEATAQQSAGGAMLFAAPVSARVISSGVTVHHAKAQSPVGVALTSAPMRRALRPRGRITKGLSLTGDDVGGRLIDRANDGEISAAPDREPPTEIITPDDLADAVEPAGSLNKLVLAIGKWLRANRWLFLAIVLGLAVLLALLLPIPVGLIAGAVVLIAAAVLWMITASPVARQGFADILTETGQTPEAVDTLPPARDFVLHPDLDLLLDPVPAPSNGTGTDGVEATRFKMALKDQYRVIGTSRGIDDDIPPLRPVDLGLVAGDIVASLQPWITVPRWTFSGVAIPGRIREQMGEEFVEAMSYPEFDTPMYEPLVKAGDDLFVPNLNLVPPDSVTLLETNQRFIESYMVGLNHEFARELLWREYPTDQRGSYFRQFWDVRKKLAQAADPVAAREELKDIKPIHRWPSTNDLGDNDNREAGPVAEEEVVLVIRGELLKKYPNTTISAQPALWQIKDGQPNKAVERVFDSTVTPIAPIYEARVAPDIYFFGFDLTAEVARGDDTVDDKPGWFFRIEEVAGDARFGFDISREAGTDINVWNDLAWADAFPGLLDGQPLNASSITSHTLVEPDLVTLQEKHDQWENDRFVPLDANLSAAELGHISLQTPVIMAIHASELLPDQEE